MLQQALFKSSWPHSSWNYDQWWQALAAFLHNQSLKSNKKHLTVQRRLISWWLTFPDKALDVEQIWNKWIENIPAVKTLTKLKGSRWVSVKLRQMICISQKNQLCRIAQSYLTMTHCVTSYSTNATINKIMLSSWKYIVCKWLLLTIVWHEFWLLLKRKWCRHTTILKKYI